MKFRSAGTTVKPFPAGAGAPAAEPEAKKAAGVAARASTPRMPSVRFPASRRPPPPRRRGRRVPLSVVRLMPTPPRVRRCAGSPSLLGGRPPPVRSTRAEPGDGAPDDAIAHAWGHVTPTRARYPGGEIGRTAGREKG